MTVEIKVPTLGESVTEATVIQWFKAAGESIATDEMLLELETDKVTLEVPSPAGGRLAEIRVEAGDNVEVGAILGLIEEGVAGEQPAKPAQATAAAPEPEIPAAAAVHSLSPAVRKLCKIFVAFLFVFSDNPALLAILEIQLTGSTTGILKFNSLSNRR